MAPLGNSGMGLLERGPARPSKAAPAFPRGIQDSHDSAVLRSLGVLLGHRWVLLDPLLSGLHKQAT